MTIIAAVRDPAQGCVWIGSDTLAVCNGVRSYLPSKWAVGKRWAVGVAGQSRFLTVIRRNTPTLDDCADAEWVADTLRGILERDGVESMAEKGEAVRFSFSALATDGRGVWSISGDFDPGGHDVYAATGSGEEFAFGAMHAGSAAGFSAERLLAAGLAASVELHDGCGIAPGGEPFVARFAGERDG